MAATAAALALLYDAAGGFGDGGGDVTVMALRKHHRFYQIKSRSTSSSPILDCLVGRR